MISSNTNGQKVKTQATPTRARPSAMGDGRVTELRLAGVVPTMPEWPADARDDALFGLAGDIVKTLDPHTEADPHALLLNVLASFGHAIGSEPHFMVGQDRHPLRLNVVLVGPSGQGRKGVSHAEVARIFERADPGFGARVTTGVSTGEGLIWAVRDQIVTHQPIKEGQRVIGYQEVVTDPGVSEKRLLVMESEFGRTIARMSRGGTLSAILRQAWDGGDLRVVTKTSPVRATDAHISVIGHITLDEVRRNLTSTEAANGFANRFLWMVVTRSKVLPDGSAPPEGQLQSLAERLTSALRFASTVTEMRRDAKASKLWRQVYPKLSQNRPGIWGSVTSRAEAQVLRLSGLYALLDESGVIKREHLLSALAIWERAEASARYVFGDSTGDELGDLILAELRIQGSLTETQIYSEVLNRHRRADRVNLALRTLEEQGLAYREVRATGGRPATVWRPT